MTDPTGENPPQSGSTFSREAHMHTTAAQALRRIAQALRLLADEIDPPQVREQFSVNRGHVTVHTTITGRVKR